MSELTYQIFARDNGDNMPLDRRTLYTIVDRPPEWFMICLQYHKPCGVAGEIIDQRRGVLDNTYANRKDEYAFAALVQSYHRLTWQPPLDVLSRAARYEWVAFQLRPIRALTVDEVIAYILLADEAGE